MRKKKIFLDRTTKIRFMKSNFGMNIEMGIHTVTGNQDDPDNMKLFQWKGDLIDCSDQNSAQGVKITYTQAQEIMDSLFSCGIRPTEAHFGDRERQALRDHLSDMQCLVFKTKKTHP